MTFNRNMTLGWVKKLLGVIESDVDPQTECDKGASSQ